jgi:sterol carrier protein 2
MTDGHRTRVFVVGVGITPFALAGKRDMDYPEMGSGAARAALDDASLAYAQVERVVAGYCYGDPTCGQKAVYNLGLTGVPIFNVNNNCSTGSTALYLARSLVEAGADCVLALGFEKMERGLSQVYQERGWTSPTTDHFDRFYADEMKPAAVGATQELANPYLNKFTDDVVKMFAYAAREHMQAHGTTAEQFAKIAEKNHRQSVNNPYAALQRPFEMDQILGSATLMAPITLLQSCATGDGAAAAVVCSEAFVRAHGLEQQAVEIRAQSMVTDIPSTLNGDSYIGLSGFDMAKRAADEVYEAAALTPQDVDVLEVHDCFSCAELFMYEALGLCDVGEGGALIDSGEWVENAAGGRVCRLGGRWVVNPSGGLESKGHPIGATGLAQCAELCWQLRGDADKRQVEGAQVALQHNFGVGGAAVVTLYARWSEGTEPR